MAYISFQPSDHFNSVLYTGNASTQTITGVGFSADLTWIKNRDTTKWHNLVDTVRGYNKYIYSNSTSNEETSTDRLTSWNSDGFALGANVYTNNSGDDHVAWNWKAGTTTGIAGSPSITPVAYSFNQTAGFSIVKYVGNATAGDSIPHGLGKIPEMMIIKKTSGSASWMVYHAGMDDPAKYLSLETTAAADSSADIWNDTVPTSTVWESGNDSNVNGSGGTYICYAFTGIKGYSKFGSYTGNGNADGAFVYTGFRPAFFMVKKTSGTNDWYIVDNRRLGYNVDNNLLFPNLTNADNTGDYVDILSNGLKTRTTDGGWNASGATYIYAAFAEFPLVSSNDIPATAR